MKAIIHGKRYDTETAIEIGSDSYNGSRSDFSWWRASLYKTKRSGAYFLAGEGHARSHYARKLDVASWGPGEKIDPMTRNEAMAWAEQHLSPEVVEAEFGDMIEEA